MTPAIAVIFITLYAGGGTNGIDCSGMTACASGGLKAECVKIDTVRGTVERHSGPCPPSPSEFITK